MLSKKGNVMIPESLACWRQCQFSDPLKYRKPDQFDGIFVVITVGFQN